MDKLDKVRFIESDIVPKEGANIKSLSTSIEITHACGCVLVEHFACGQTPRRPDESDESYQRRQAERKYYVKLCPEHQAQFDDQTSKKKKPMKKKELKIRFHHDDKGYCREFWEIFPEDNQKQPCFILRDTSGPGGSWRIASGEFFEPSFEVSDEATLILCNHAWEEHLRVGNDKGRFPVGFPTLQEACHEAWNDFAGKPARLLDTPDFWRWFAPHLPPELSSWEQDNWRDNNRQTIASEVLARFDFCGDEMAIVRITERHTKCGLMWRKYFADWTDEDRATSYAMFYGFEVGVDTDNR